MGFRNFAFKAFFFSLLAGCSQTPTSQLSSMTGSNSSQSAGESALVSQSLQAVNESLNAQSAYAFTGDDLSALQTENLVTANNRAALSSIVAH